MSYYKGALEPMQWKSKEQSKDIEGKEEFW